MDRIKNKRELLHSDISEKIIGCCFEVMKELEEYNNELLSFFKSHTEDKALDSSSCCSS